MDNREETDNPSGGGPPTAPTIRRGGGGVNGNHHHQQHHRGHQHQRQLNWARQRSMSMCGGGGFFNHNSSYFATTHQQHHHAPTHAHQHHHHPLETPGESQLRQRRASEGSASLMAKRAKRWRRRHPLIRNSQAAPNNNNQFLMDEHEHDHEQAWDDTQNYSSPEDEEDYQSRDFRQTYNGLKSERLQSMSKEQLIYANQLLELRVESLESKLSEILKEKLDEDKKSYDDVFVVPPAPPSTPCGNRSTSPTQNGPNTHLRFIQQEMLRLRQENWELKQENNNLKSGSKDGHAQDEAVPLDVINVEHLQIHQEENQHESTEEEEEGVMMMMEEEFMASPHHHHSYFRPAQTTAGI